MKRGILGITMLKNKRIKYTFGPKGLELKSIWRLGFWVGLVSNVLYMAILVSKI